MKNIRLFNECSITSFLNNRDELIRENLRRNLDGILKSNPKTLSSEIADKYRIKVPSFDFGSTTNKVEPTPERYMNRFVMTDYVVYEIPFTGNEEILKCAPSQTSFRLGYPLIVTVIGNKISFYINSQGLVSNPGQPRERVKRHAEMIKDYITCSLEGLSLDIESWNDSIGESLYAGISDTKKRLEENLDRKKTMEDDLNPFK